MLTGSSLYVGAASCVPRTLASTVASILGVAGAVGLRMAVCIAAATVASMLGGGWVWICRLWSTGHGQNRDHDSYEQKRFHNSG